MRKGNREREGGRKERKKEEARIKTVITAAQTVITILKLVWLVQFQAPYIY